MSLQSYQELIIAQTADGTAITAAAAASCIHASAKYTLPPNFFSVGKMLRLKAQGRISNVVTTPGTARFDLRFGSTVVWDSGALNLNIVAKTNVPWDLEVLLRCTAIGQSTSALLIGIGRFQSEAVIASPLSSVGGNGSLLCPVGAPAVGTGFDSTLSQAIDLFFTQTVATGSLTVHNYQIEALN